jgi:hypothetical protein
MKEGWELAEDLFERDNMFVASIVPNLLDRTMKTEEGGEIYGRIHPPENYYPDWAIQMFKENRNNPRILWAQEGYRHCCGRCFDRYEQRGGREADKAPDPFHEHVCLDGNVQNLEKQIEVIQAGKKLIQEKLGITPTAYCPPNHMYNKDTKLAVQSQGFVYFMTRNGFDYFKEGLVELPVHFDENGLIILPESKSRKSPIVMTYFDHINDGRFPDYNSIINSFVPMSIMEEPKIKSWLSDELIVAYKKLRDFKKR